MALFRDRGTGEELDDADLDDQYHAYVAELEAELPDVQPCSFKHWLRGELQDRLVEIAGGTEGP
ncbi:hypothetical protein H7I87_00575 [Mycobacterium timonense]|uniref:Uncharacterized protein n=1 Tax=Mycobacterium bouchedurhonense TaxID=701041 RepID=A0AAW5S0M0_MYCBC|nr:MULTISPECIES: hypothetical protein [Mycobacterium avium complex (MAC)]MCV6988712.1 hypothetical protein [Mycobacterium bouchedurhonense]MCV6993260.1 hypothetical protein [Mycobacterium timonense]MDV3306621.1 hypothetical protein [Mycobacterium avium subsp. hominissuis]ORA45503.1 hypothetical protein BST19_19975 [Mycobacterium bouchedurhonense]